MKYFQCAGLGDISLQTVKSQGLNFSVNTMNVKSTLRQR